MDRRTRYTKMILNDTLIRFLEKKELARITVTEICREADINRSTYYSYFLDQYDQLAKLKADLLGEVTDYIMRIDTRSLKPDESRYQILNSLLAYVESKKNIFRILLGNSGDHNLQEEILQILGEKAFSRDLPENLSREETNYLLMYAANGCFGLFYHWLMAENPIPAERMAKLMADFTGNMMK